jgi:hypothetical protein
MISAQYPITQGLDDHGRKIWIVNGERFYSLLDAEERQRDFEGDTDRPDIAPVEHSGG